MAKKITIDIDPKGNCKIEGEGFVGPECDKFLSEIESELGETTVSKQKPEYNERQRGQDRNTQQSRG